ncbi:MAG: hypothetical protein ACTHLE_20190 [Agriterribacter sp.]
MKAARMPQDTIDGTTSRRRNIYNKFEGKKPLDFKKDGGINILDPTDQLASNDLFDTLDEYGIFTVRGGELESWLKKLGTISLHSPDWLMEIFDKMGSNPTEPGYLKPETGDVWDFLFKIRSWLSNVDRKGMM